MLTGEIRNQVDRVWDAFWSGGISNPLEVVEQFTYLLFIKRLDELETQREQQLNTIGHAAQAAVFPAGTGNLRWSRLKNMAPALLYETLANEVFPFIKTLGDSTFAAHMRDARFTLPPEKAALLAKVVDLLDAIPMEQRDTKGDLYEYMLSKLATAGQNGQFRTPRHIIELIVAMAAPQPSDTICDPACGTAGFLVGASAYVRAQHPQMMYDMLQRDHFQRGMFHGFDFDQTMLRVAAMNMLLHGIERPVIENRDSLAQSHADSGAYSLILANPPFAGSLDYASTAKDLQALVKTKKTELLFMALFLRLLRPGGRAAVIVPDGVLFGSSTAHKTLRRMLVEDHKLEGVVSLPSGVFKPYAGVSTAILFFTRTDSGGTDTVWFYDMQADGFSLDDKRTPLPNQHATNNLPDILQRWQNRPAERERQRTDQSFLVPRAEIAANDYDLSINRYKQLVHAQVEYPAPATILAELDALELEIQSGLAELRELLG